MRETTAAIMLLTVLCSTTRATAQEAVGFQPFEYEPLENLIIPDVEGDERVALVEELQQSGVAEVEAGRWEMGARQLEVAYILGAEPLVLVPLAQALRELDFLFAAQERLERVLEVSDDVELRGAALRELEMVRRGFGVIRISTDPPGASISIEGRVLGTTPFSEPIFLIPGEHAVSASLEGYRDVMRRVVVELVREGEEPVEILLQLQSDEERHVPPSPPRPLDGPLWAVFSVAAASAAALVVTAVVGATQVNALEAADYPSQAESRAVEGWVNASFWMAGLTATSGIGAIILAIIHAKRQNAPESEGMR